MASLARHPKTLFVGQAVRYDGQRAHQTFKDVPMERRIEMPVAEDFQMGFCTGLALEGYIPVCFYPRWDFLLIAANQLVNHLDKMPHFGFHPKVIIRTAVGAKSPLDPGPQHTQNHSQAFQMMLWNIPVFHIWNSGAVREVYEIAMSSESPSIVVEHMERY